jgi:hypothetical protein
VKGWKKIYQASVPPKQAGVVILVSDKVDFKLTLVKVDKGHLVLIKGAIHQKEITMLTYMHPMSVHPISSNTH